MTRLLHVAFLAFAACLCGGCFTPQAVDYAYGRPSLMSSFDNSPLLARADGKNLLALPSQIKYGGGRHRSYPVSWLSHPVGVTRWVVLELDADLNLRPSIAWVRS